MQANPQEAVGVGVSQNTAHAGALINNGTIRTAGSYGGNAIKIMSPIDSITNNGTISWTGPHHGISAQFYNGSVPITINSFTNSGSIGSTTGQFSALYIGFQSSPAAITLTTLTNTGRMFSGSGPNAAGVSVGRNGTITTINNQNGGYIQSVVAQNQGTITNLNNQGSIDKVDIQNGGNIANITVNQGGKVTLVNNSSTTYSANINLEGANSSIGTLQNQGTMNGTVKVQNGASLVNVSNAGNMGATIENTAGSAMSVTNNGTMSGAITSNGQTTIHNAGTLSSTITASNALTVSNQAGANLSGAITATQGANIDNAGTLSGAITANQGANINNSGTLSGAVTASNLNVNNTGAITTDTLTNTSGRGVINNQATGTIKTLTNTAGTMDVTNSGAIQEGIKIDSGTLNLSNKITGTIGKNANNAQIELAAGAKANVNEWHIDALEFSAAEQDKALQIKGGAENVTMNKVYVSGSVKKGVVFDSNTFIYDVDANKFNGAGTDGGKGINVDNIEHVSGLYKFSRANDVGGYTIGLDTNELSGQSLGQSSIFSTRFRSLSVANLLNTLEVRRFADENNATRQRDDNLLSMQQIDENNLAYAFGYLGFESVRMPEGDSRMRGYTEGLLGGALKYLSDELGVLGFYLGYDSTNRSADAQRLNADEYTRYVGLTYYNEFESKELEYYLRLGTRLDFSTMEAVKQYNSAGESANTDYKSIGYNLNAKVGMNFYHDDARLLLSPELGLNYQGQSVDAFSFNRGGVIEHYAAAQNHFIDVLAGISAKKALTDKLRLHTSLGTMLNVFDRAQSKLRITHTDGTIEESPSSTISTSKWYAYAQAGLIFSVTPSVDVALHYLGIAGENSTYAHNGFLKLGVWW